MQLSNTSFDKRTPEELITRKTTSKNEKHDYVHPRRYKNRVTKKTEYKSFALSELIDNPKIPKPFNLSQLQITDSIVLPPGVYNVLYATANTPIVVTLPVLAQTINGAPLFWRNYGPEPVTINKSTEDGGATVATVLADQTIIIVSDYPNDWHVVLGPISTTGGGSGNVSGPPSSYDNSIAIWNGVNGDILKDSHIGINEFGDLLFGVDDETPAGVISIEASIADGNGVWTLPGGVTDTIIGEDTINIITNKTLTDSSNIVYSRALVTGNGSGAVICGNSAAPSNGQILIANGPTAASWSTLSLSGDIIGTYNATQIAAGAIVNADINASAAIADTKLDTISTAGKVANSATTATAINTNGAIVARDGSGNFAAGTITANITGNVSGSAATFTGSLSGDITGTMGATAIAAGVIVNADINASAAIADTKLATISTAGKVSNSATTATAANTVSSIVARDGSGNFAAGTITAALTGDVTGNVSGSSATFTGSLSGDITGTMGATAIAAGVIVNADINAAAAIADTKLATISTAGKVANSATTATAINTNGAIVARDGSGNFAAGTITANITGNVSGSAATFTGSLSGDITGTMGATAIAAGVIVNADISASAAIADTKLATITTGGKVANSATTATDTNSANAIVARDGSGNFAAGTITASLTGDVTGNVSGSSATFTGSLSGDITGTMGATAIAAGVIVNADISASAGIVDTKLDTISTGGKVANSATTATAANTASSIVARDGSGNFAAGTITANITGNVSGSSATFTGSLSGDITGTMGATAIAAGVIVNADINAAAGIVDTKLATITTGGKVANSATTATSANNTNTIVLRDGSGSFLCGSITSDGTVVDFVTTKRAISYNILSGGNLNVQLFTDTPRGLIIRATITYLTPTVTIYGSFLLNYGYQADGVSDNTFAATLGAIEPDYLTWGTPIYTTLPLPVAEIPLNVGADPTPFIFELNYTGGLWIKRSPVGYDYTVRMKFDIVTDWQ